MARVCYLGLVLVCLLLLLPDDSSSMFFRRRRRRCSPVNCAWASWSGWGSCDTPCGNTGVQTRKRVAAKPASCGGQACTGSKTETKPCNRMCQNGGKPLATKCDCQQVPFYGRCCENECATSAWSNWGSCNASCEHHKGYRTRTQSVMNRPECRQNGVQEEACVYECGEHGHPDRDGNCECYAGFSGECCQYEPCKNMPCKNGGQMSCSTSGDFLCDCPDHFTGRYCEQRQGKTTTPKPSCDPTPFSMFATCDNQMLVYIDGKLQNAPSSELNDWTKTSTFKMSACTRTVAIECKDSGVVGGILVSASHNSLISDATWRCSDEQQKNWMQPNFVETSGKWQNARLFGKHGVKPWGNRPSISPLAHWIWTSVNNRPKTVYCRKQLRP